MSKPVKELIVSEYRRRFEGVDSGVLVEIRGLDAGGTGRLRSGLRGRGIRVTVIKNSLARKAFEGTLLDALRLALVGPTALVHGAESVVEVARELVDWAKKVKQLQLRAACLDGTLFEGAEGVARLSTLPTREEAQARVVTLLLSPARNLVGAAVGPGSKLLGIVKEIRERLEKGEAIAKVAG
jgi:large subunit ribosomal protein L10